MERARAVGRPRRRLAGQRGAAMVEFALAFPILSMVVLGVVDAGRAYVTWVHVENAAREGALYASLHPAYQANTGACADPQNIPWHANNESTSSSYTVTISPVTSSSCTDAPTDAPAGSNITVTVTDNSFTLLTPLVANIMGSIHPKASVTARIAG